jgi:hypothetical protein
MVTKWEVEFTDEFGDWWFGLDEAEQESVDASVRLLESAGPWLGFPFSSKVNGSKHAHMRELRIQHIRFASCTPSTHAVAPFCSLAVIRPEMVAGTCTTFRLQTGCMTNT